LKEAGEGCIRSEPFKKEQIIFTINRAMRWQQMKRDATRMEGMFTLGPCDKAREAFEREYVIRLLERCDGDPKVAAERSGLRLERVASLKEEEASKAS
jgi:hypothetical protein